MMMKMISGENYGPPSVINIQLTKWASRNQGLINIKERRVTPAAQQQNKGTYTPSCPQTT